MSSEKKFLPKLYPTSKEISKTWFVLYTAANGTRQKVYGNLNNLTTLEERLIEADKIIKNILAEKPLKTPAAPGNQLLTDLAAVYELRCPGWKPKTKSAYQTHLYAFARWYRESGCPSMNSLEALKFLNHVMQTGSGATTRNNYRGRLKSLFADLVTFYAPRYTTNPFAGVKKLRESSKTKQWFRPAQVEQVSTAIARADKWLYLAVQLQYHCFPRPNEIRQLKVADINFETQKLRVESSAAKTSRIRFVPVPDQLIKALAFLKTYPEQFYIFGSEDKPGLKMNGRDYLSKQHKKIMQALQYPPGYTFYSWKNTGAVKMLMHDRRPMRYISKCMGHHSMDMTDKYFESLGVDEMGETIIFPDL